MKKKTIKKVGSYILACILGIIVLTDIVTMRVYDAVFDRNRVEQSLVESGYYHNMYEIIHNDIENYRMQSGFDEKIYNGIITESMIETDVNEVLNAIFENRKVNISTEAINTKLDENIQKEIQEKNYAIDEEAQKNIDDFKQVVTETYRTNIFYSEEIIGNISKYYQKIGKILKTTIVALTATAVVLCFIIFKLRKSSIGISLVIAGAILIFANIYSGMQVTINNIMIVNWAFSKSITNILNKLLNNLFIIGIVATIAGFVWIVAFEYKRSKKICEYENKRVHFE